MERFEREAELASSIDSPYVVEIYEHGFTNNYGFLAMEFFSRGDLDHRVNAGIPAGLVREYAIHLARGLKAVHDAGIVHRDLKPANVMFRGDDQLAIADFGISRRIDADSSLTRTGSVLGTPLYMSPEQLRAAELDKRTDIYSAGIMLFEMLTGKRPFEADSIGALAMKHLRTPPPDLPESMAGLAPIFKKMVAKDPADRYSDMGEVADDLEKVDY